MTKEYFVPTNPAEDHRNAVLMKMHTALINIGHDFQNASAQAMVHHQAPSFHNAAMSLAWGCSEPTLGDGIRDIFGYGYVDLIRRVIAGETIPRQIKYTAPDKSDIETAFAKVSNLLRENVTTKKDFVKFGFTLLDSITTERDAAIYRLREDIVFTYQDAGYATQWVNPTKWSIYINAANPSNITIRGETTHKESGVTHIHPEMGWVDLVVIATEMYDALLKVIPVEKSGITCNDLCNGMSVLMKANLDKARTVQSNAKVTEGAEAGDSLCFSYGELVKFQNQHRPSEYTLRLHYNFGHIDSVPLGLKFVVAVDGEYIRPIQAYQAYTNYGTTHIKELNDLWLMRYSRICVYLAKETARMFHTKSEQLNFDI